jgi:gluconate 2-dehydrogenase alpha chain
MSTSTPDVVVIGAGWAGSVVATELALAGHRVTILERGEHLDPQDDRQNLPSERHAYCRARSQRADRETYTLRHDSRYQALPLRSLGAFLVGEGVGGGGVLWGGNSPRLSEGAFKARSLLDDRALGFAEEIGSQLADWPFSFAEIERDMQQFEELIGVAGSAGIIGGTRTGTGNPLEGSRSGEYPVTPEKLDDATLLVAKAAADLGMQPYDYPTANLHHPYTNAHGVTRGPSAVAAGQIASPQNTVLPTGLATGNLSIVIGANVRRLIVRGGRVVAVRYIDGDGEHELAAERFVLAAWALNNTRLMLLSGIGAPYDPRTGTGVIGRNHSNHFRGGTTGFFPAGVLEERSDSPSAGIAISDFDPHAWRTGDPYVGGALLAAFGPRLHFELGSATPDNAPSWGPDWVRSLHANRGRAVSIYVQGEVSPQRDRYLDLDPRYTDAWGDPLLRLNYDTGENERRMARDLGGRAVDLLREAGAQHVNAPETLQGHYDTVPYQNSHATGGVVAGDDPATSGVDPNLASWDAPNLWVVGSSAFPNAGAANPTITVGALALRVARAIHDDTSSSSVNRREVR